jgi:hypothetical protein
MTSASVMKEELKLMTSASVMKGGIKTHDLGL